MKILQTNEFEIRPNCEPQLLPKEVWSRFGQSIDQHYRFTVNYCSFYGQEYHSLMNCPFIEHDVGDAMIIHFHIQAQSHLNSEKDHNLLAT